MCILHPSEHNSGGFLLFNQVKLKIIKPLMIDRRKTLYIYYLVGIHLSSCRLFYSTNCL